jgi:hypothetical protein
LDDNLHVRHKLDGVLLGIHMIDGAVHNRDVPLDDRMMFYDVDTF